VLSIHWVLAGIFVLPAKVLLAVGWGGASAGA
jgi:hypothetical protein